VSRLILTGRLCGLVIIDVEVALDIRHVPALVLAVVANLAALTWMLGRSRLDWVSPAAVATMGCAGGLLGAIEHGSFALALPALAVMVALADASAVQALATFSLAILGLEVGALLAHTGVVAAIGYPAILLGAALFGLSRRQYIAQARDAEARLALTGQTEEANRQAATFAERARIAREIHDLLAHALGGLGVQLEAAELLLSERGDIEGARDRIRACRQTALEGLEEARRAVAALRTDTPPLPDRLADLVTFHRDQGSIAELTVEGQARPLSPEVELAFTRTAQEALTNARRHAPGAPVTVALSYEDGRTSVTVTNAAGELEPVGGGYGLAGMRERLELNGGRLAAGPSADGWQVYAEVPG
jgi:signal transduction histidine kinase